MGWDGVAMVEYRVDPATGRYALMEVNGTFLGLAGDSHPRRGGLPVLAVSNVISHARMPPMDYRVGVTARSLVGDTKWLIAVLRERKGCAARAMVDIWPRSILRCAYFMWAWDDPKLPISNLIGTISAALIVRTFQRRAGIKCLPRGDLWSS